MTTLKLRYPKVKPHNFYGITICLIVKDFILPSVWAERDFHLVRGYANPGKKFVLRSWQRAPVDAITQYSTVILCGCVQFGKSLIAEIILWWTQANRPINALCVYAKKETVEDVFQDRFRPALQEVPALQKLWSGNPDNLTIKKLSLLISIIRMASAGVRNDIASHPSGHIYLSELAKYREAGFDVVKLARGRQEAYGITGNKTEVFESSPLEIGDPLHIEMYKIDVLNLEFFWPCPICGYFQIYELKQIKELPNSKKEFDHDVLRIRNDDAARYECLHCGNDIPEDTRIKNHEKGVWAAIGEVISADGKIVSERKKTSKVSFRWSRLVDYSFKFSECLARFFEASRAGKPTVLKDFLNEDMAEFWNPKVEERPTSWLMAKCKPYLMKDPTIPAGVLAVFIGVDTQDKGFWYVMRGFGARKESWLLDCDYIACDMENDQAYNVVLDKVRDRINKKSLVTVDGRQLFVNWAFVDRGGHKAKYVDHIVSNLPGFYAYIGSNEKLHPLIKAGKEELYWGNTENLSRIVASDCERENWHLPEDIPTEYLNQFVKHYDREEIDRYGNTIKRWMKGGNDHCRDCEAYIQGALIASQIDEMLEKEDTLDELKRAQVAQSQPEQPEKQVENNYFSDIQRRWQRRGGG
jgi:phage terminase large subunit GpA-like protein